MANIRHTIIGEPQKAFPAIVRECELAVNMSYASEEIDDGEGNLIRYHLWINGDWKVEYKGKEYLVRMEDNLNALINWINGGES